VDLNHVTVSSPVLDASRAFYRLLGLRLIVETDDYLRFECPDGTGTLSVEHADEGHAPGSTTIFLECQDLDEEVQRLVAAGVSFEHGPVDQPWLWREARLRDPAGHRICLFWAGSNRLDPPWRLESG
jgi:catechol 2,3-dioxygenase-like lactoylglutathione lyase family enzyme